VGSAKTVQLSNTYGGTDVGNYTITDQASASASITAKALSISGITATDKIYDGNATASVSTTGVTSAVLQANGLIAGDSLTVSSTGNFRNSTNTSNDKNVGSAKTVQLSNTYGGTDVGNYTITDQATTSASITPKTVLIYGLKAANKIYDTSKQATIKGQAKGDFVEGDLINQIRMGDATFQDSKVGQNKLVTFNSIMLYGPDSQNYVPVISSELRANIVPSEANLSSRSNRIDVFTPSNVSLVFTPPNSNQSGQLGSLDILVPQTTPNDFTYIVKLDKYFSSLDNGDALISNIEANLKSGEDLPAWLKFDPSTLILSISPTGMQKKNLALLVGSQQNQLSVNIASRS
jgi:hypothetical protein